MTLKVVKGAKGKAKKAYELLATDEVDNHINGLRLLEIARVEDATAVLKFEQELEQHKLLTIEAQSKYTIIYLADENNHLVQQEVGIMQTSVLPGTYIVRFDNDEEQTIKLVKDMVVKQ
jgi:hypothetical protein